MTSPTRPTWPRSEALGAADGFRLAHLKDAPRNFPFYRSLILRTEDMHLDGPNGPVTLSTTIKLFSVGTSRSMCAMPVSWQRITDLVAYHDLRFRDNTTLDERIQAVVERLLETVKPQLDTPVAALEPPEVYTIFSLNPPLTDAAAGPGGEESMEDWLRRNQREVAALLDGETDATRLSDQEVQDTMKHKYSYYHYDLAVLDWEAALLVDTPEGCLETVYILEVANLQLEELKVYDAKLDAVLDKAYDDVEAVARLPRLDIVSGCWPISTNSTVIDQRVPSRVVEHHEVSRAIGTSHRSTWAVRPDFTSPNRKTSSARSSHVGRPLYDVAARPA